MRDYDEYDADGGPYVVIEQQKNGMGLFLFGLALGAGAALLFAPQSGVETRRIIRDRARTAGDTARQKADEMVATVTSAVGDMRERFTERVDVAKSAIREQRDEMVDAFEVGRSVAHDARLELERKLAEQRQARRAGKEV